MNVHVAQLEALGAVPAKGGTRFTVRSEAAERVWVSLFGEDGEAETARIELFRVGPDGFSAFVPGIAPGARYGFRADGPFAPERGLWFDPEKLLTDPYALRIDRPYRYDQRLGLPRGEAPDTASLMPKAVVTALPRPRKLAPPVLPNGRMIYELGVRAFSMLHPAVPAEHRGTLAALAHPAVIDHLVGLGVGAVELMPVTAWMDERHLGPLGLANAWGYNPVSFMALDPRLAPGGIADLRDAAAALHKAGIGVILDLVFNHTAESDLGGPTLSLRGLDANTYFRHALDGRLINDAGTGNTIACDHPTVQKLVLDSLRHFVLNAGVDGFRFDLAPVLGRRPEGFDPAAPLLQAMRADAVIGGRLLVAEPWDVGPGGYQLGRFGAPFLEWNDRFRDDVRRFWRGDAGTVGALATRLAGSFDVFPGEATRSVNFVAAHDGLTLADTVAYATKHNEANGEGNRDGHGENHSWNNGVEGATSKASVRAARARDRRALIATLFASRGAIMLAAGDERGRTQHGNNNAYAQDNAAFWPDWRSGDEALQAYVAELAAFRARTPALKAVDRLSGEAAAGRAFPDVQWLQPAGPPMDGPQWSDPQTRRLTMLLDGGERPGSRVAVCFNSDRRRAPFVLPRRDGWRWALAVEPVAGEVRWSEAGPVVPGRAVVFLEEMPA